jgi:acetyltransferase-like isoleucine patch superfamily enzyme
MGGVLGAWATVYYPLMAADSPPAWRRLVRRVTDPVLLRLARRMAAALDADREDTARAAARLDPAVVIGPHARVFNLKADPAAITVAGETRLDGLLIVLWDSGQIRIGRSCHISEGCRLVSHSSITIGDRVWLGPLVDVLDTNGHPMALADWRADVEAIMSGNLQNRRPEGIVSKPVVLDDDVWIGPKAVILKGVHVGRGAAVMAGAVVLADVPPGAIVAGNPARVMEESGGARAPSEAPA